MSSPMIAPCTPGDKGAAVIAVGAVFTSLATLLTGLRVYVRTRLVQAGLGWDDLSIVIALVGTEYPRIQWTPSN